MKSQFSLWRQTDNVDDITVNQTDAPVGDLIGLFFPPLAELQNASVEVIECEWIDGSYISSAAGAITANADYKYSITDVSDYQYVLIPNFKKGTTTTYSGLCSGAGTTVNPRWNINTPTGYTDSVMGYLCVPVDSTNYYVAVTEASGSYMPVLGIKLTV